MKTLKKSFALLLAFIMLFSAFAFVIANADDLEGRTKVNVRVTPPQVGNKADETIKLDDERYVPGLVEELVLSLSPESYIDEFEKAPTSDEAFKKLFEKWFSAGATEFDKAYYEARYLLIKNGITWIEYDSNDFQKMIDAGLFTRDELEAEMKKLSKLELIGYLLHSSGEYGGAFENSNISSSARFMKPGEAFKEGKSYMCWCQAFIDIKAETNEYIKSCYAIKPYYEKKAEINKKLETATEEEAAELNSQLDALNTQYKDGLDTVNANISVIQNKCKSIGGTNREAPIITVNGDKTEETFKGMWVTVYDFGKAAEKAEEKQSFIDKIRAFIEMITEFFKNLFSFIHI